MTPTPSSAPGLLEAQALSKRFKLRRTRPFEAARAVHAISGVSLRVAAGTTLGIVGESGCGKSTLARLLMNLIVPDEGRILIDGEVLRQDGARQKAYRRTMQMVFQDSYASLNPRLMVEESIMFGPRMHGVPRREARERAHHLLDKVGLEPVRFVGRYPHELSGGQRQRVNVARALALQPRIVILDEAVSALDKSLQAQVLNLLLDLKNEFGLTYLFISHDLNVVDYVSDRVMVMYLGKVVEEGSVERLYAAARHPYTRALLASMPSNDPDHRTAAAPIQGEMPSPIDPPSGCRFRTRCPFAEDVCTQREPNLVVHQDHAVACHMTQPDSGHSRAGEPIP